MPNSVGGSYRTTTENKMKAFDNLPPAVRQALANSIEDWVPQPLLTRIRKHTGGDRIAFGVRTIKRWDKEELATRHDQRRRGVGPYKGLLPDPDYVPKRKERKK